MTSTWVKRVALLLMMMPVPAEASKLVNPNASELLCNALWHLHQFRVCYGKHSRAWCKQQRRGMTVHCSTRRSVVPSWGDVWHGFDYNTYCLELGSITAGFYDAVMTTTTTTTNS